MKKVRVIVFGSSGFIGGSVCRFLAKELPCTILGLTSKSCNLLMPQSVRKALGGITRKDVLVIASAVTRSVANDVNSMLGNVQMVENLCRVLVKRPVASVVFLSSVDVYGTDIRGDGIVRETTELNPCDCYATSKVICELLLKRVCNAAEIPLTVMRLTGVYGPGDGGQSTIGVLVRAAEKHGRIVLHGAGDDLRDYVNIRDVCRLIKCAVLRPGYRIVNVGSGQSYTIRSIASLIRNNIGPHVRVVFGREPRRSGKRLAVMMLDCGIMRSAFPQVKATSMTEGVAEYVAHSKNANGRGD